MTQARKFNWLLALLLISFGMACKNAPKAEAGAADTCRYIEQGFGAPGQVRIRAEKVVTGLEVPWSLAFLPNKSILVTERAGRVRLIQKGKLLAKPVTTLAVDQTDEAGLLGMALHPDFPKNPWVYFYYTLKKNGKSVNRVERFKLSSDGTSATPDRVILDDIPAAKYHSGGRLRFGPDKMLYIGTGDSREPELSQKLESLAGKILRITPEGKIPSDNPWKNNLAYVIGIRNTQGFDWLKVGTLVVSDHGPSGELGRRGGDELSLARAGDNLGWPKIWGCERNSKMITPVLTWNNAAPPGGAAVYTGDGIPEWKGSVILGTLRSTHLHRVQLKTADGKMVVDREEVYLSGEAPKAFGRLREVIMSPEGELYVTTSNCDDRGECGPEKDLVLRIVKDSPAP